MIEPASSVLVELYRLTDRLSAARGLEAVLGEILSAAMTLTDSDMGNIGLYTSRTHALDILVYRGFPDDYVAYMTTIKTPVKRGPSEKAFATRRRVIIPDVYDDPAFEPTLPWIEKAGFVSMQATPILSRTGEPIGTICTYRRDHGLPSQERLDLLDLYGKLAADAIERENAEASLRESEERFRRLHELTVRLSGVHSWEESLNETLSAVMMLVQADSGVLRLFENEGPAFPLLAFQGIPKNFLDHFGAMTPELDAAAPSRDAISKGAPVVIPDILGHPSFQPHLGIIKESGFRSALAIPLFNQAGRPLGGMCVFWLTPHDPTEEQLQIIQLYARLASDTIERLARNAEMGRTEHALREALATKDQFLGIVSHELRTPMTMIRGLASVLRRNPDINKDSLNDAYRDLGDASERLYRLIENMLVLARLEVGQAPVTEFLLVDKLLTSIAKRLQGEMLRLKLAVGPVPSDVIVVGNRQYFEQVVRNLVENAHKYSETGAEVELQVSEENNDLRFMVLDRGIGLTNHEAIFQPFEREAKAEQAAPGLGLGLAVCKTLVEAQGGRIWAEPRQGGGTVFNFTLPLARDREV